MTLNEYLNSKEMTSAADSVIGLKDGKVVKTSGGTGGEAMIIELSKGVHALYNQTKDYINKVAESFMNGSLFILIKTDDSGFNDVYIRPESMNKCETIEGILEIYLYVPQYDNEFSYDYLDNRNSFYITEYTDGE